MATLASPIGHARTITSKNSTTLTDAIGIELANEALLWFRQRLAEKRKDVFAAETTINITSSEILGGGSPGIFNVPTNTFLVVKALFVSYRTPTDQSSFQRANQTDPSNTPDGVSFDWLRRNQPESKPLFDYRGNTFEILPTPTVTSTGGIKAWTYTAPTEYTATTDTLAYPESVNWRILGRLIAGFYLDSIGEDGSKYLQRAEAMVDSFIAVIGSGTQQPTQPQPLQLTGYEF